ncbi:MAG TPA: oligosaccharide flippase family protein [Vicinamibacterales bacterium]|jgi:O-antigen/teichoic acid export membrane protein
MNSTDIDSSPAAARAAAPGTEPVRTHIRGSSLLLIGRQVSLLLNLAVQVLTVRYLAKAEYGAFAYALAFVAPGANAIALGLGRAMSRFLPIYEERDEHAKIVGAILLSVGTILLLGAVVILSIFGLQNVLVESRGADPLAASLLVILVVLCPTQALENLFSVLLAVFASARAIFFRRHILGPCLKLMVVLLLIGAHADVRFLAFGYVIAGLLGASTSAVLLIRIFRDRGLLKRSYLRQSSVPWKEVFSFSLPLLSFDLTLALRNFITVVVLQYFHALEAVAVFRAVLPIARLNEVVTESFRLLFTPAAARFFARDDGSSMEELYWQTAAWVSLLSFPIFAVTYFIAEPLSVFLFGKAYAGAGSVLAILSLAYYFHAAMGFNSLTLRVFGNVRSIVTIDLATASISLLLTALVVPFYGAVGAALAMGGTLVIQTALYHRALSRVTGISVLPLRYRRAYTTVLLAMVSLQIIQLVVTVPLVPGLGLASIASLLVFWLNRDLLDIQRTFPEILRVPFMRQLLGAPGR